MSNRTPIGPRRHRYEHVTTLWTNQRRDRPPDLVHLLSIHETFGLVELQICLKTKMRHRQGLREKEIEKANREKESDKTEKKRQKK